MTYLSDKRRSRLRYRFYGGAVLFLGILVYTWPIIQKVIHPYTERVAIQYSTSKSTIQVAPSSIITFFSSKADLTLKNRELEISVERLENALAEKEGQLQELRSRKEDGAPEAVESISMYPLMGDVTTIYSTILLSKGAADGLLPNGLVYLRGRQVVCFLKEVHDKTSLCKLFSSHGENVEGVTGGLTLFLKGEGGSYFTGDVPKGTELSIGDRVLLKSDETMTLGVIADIKRDDQVAFWKVYVRGGYNPTKSDIFYIDGPHE